MYFVLDPAVPDCLTVYFWSETQQRWELITRPVECGMAPAFYAALGELGIELAQCQGIGVFVGQGRFTATRLAVVLANTLALARGSAVVAINQAPTQPPSELFSTCARYISPVYSGAPRLGRTTAIL